MELIIPVTLYKNKACKGLNTMIDTLNAQEQLGNRIGRLFARQWKLTLDLEEYITAVIGESQNDNIELSNLCWWGVNDQWYSDITTDSVLPLLYRKYGRALSSSHLGDRTLTLQLGIGIEVFDIADNYCNYCYR